MHVTMRILHLVTGGNHVNPQRETHAEWNASMERHFDNDTKIHLYCVFTIWIFIVIYRHILLINVLTFAECRY